MNLMEYWEVEEILDNLEYYDSPSWDRCRLQVHALVALFSKKRLSPEDLMKFPWDKDGDEAIELPTTIEKEDIERLRAKAHNLNFNN